MEIDLAAMHGWIVKELACKRSIAESMESLIDLCEQARPHSDWDKLRALPYADLTTLTGWIQSPFQDEPPVRPLRGLWFGLFNPYSDGPVADIYLCGSERFIPDPDDNLWAVGPDWRPKARYAESEILKEIYRIAYCQGGSAAERKGALANGAEYPLCLGYGAFAVRELLTQLDAALILGKSESLGVAVGFDSGDFVLLGMLTDHGLVPFDAHFVPDEIPIEQIIDSLRSSDTKEAFLAVMELRRLGDHARVSVPDLANLATTAGQFGLRQAALDALAAIAPDDPRVKTAVIQALQDTNAYVRQDALRALIAIKELSEQDLVRIKSMENDLDCDVARWSEIALRNIRLRQDGSNDADYESALDEGE